MLQVVDLQKDQRFQGLDVELLSMAPDSLDDWKRDAKEYGVTDMSTVLSDADNRVATEYDVMQWAAATGEPGHTFILVDERGEIAWIRDYGAAEHGGLMFVVPEEIVREIRPHVG